MIPEFNQMKDELNGRFDKIEEKLDKALEVSNTNKNDISWMKGFAKISITIITTIISGLVGLFFTSHK